MDKLLNILTDKLTICCRSFLIQSTRLSTDHNYLDELLASNNFGTQLANTGIERKENKADRQNK